MPLFVVLEVSEICHQLILDAGIVLGRYVSTRDVLGDLERKRVHVLAGLEPAVEPLQHFLLGVEVLVAGELPPVLGGAFEPLAVLIS